MVNAHGRDIEPTATLVSATDTPALLARVSWGAIFAGAVIAMGLLILLGLLGTAIGFRAIDPQQSNAFNGVGVGAGIWWIVTSIIALGIGGWVAGRLSGIPKTMAAAAHAASVWGLLTLVMLWLATSSLGAAVNTATGAVTGAARVASSATTSAGAAVLEPGGVSANQAENQVAGVVDSVQNDLQQIEPENPARTAESALDALSSASWYAFFASLLSLVAAMVAGAAGAPNKTFIAARDKVDL